MSVDKNDAVDIRRVESLYDGYMRLDRYTLRHRLHEGGWTDEINREVLERGRTAAVLPFDPVRDAVVLIEQFRIGAYAAGLSPWLTEIVAGVIESDESPDELVRREAREEAGIEIGALEPIADVLLTPGVCTENVRIYAGRTDAGNAGGVHGLDDENEDILVRVLPYALAAELLNTGNLSNAVTVIALQWLVINHDRLLAQWS